MTSSECKSYFYEAYGNLLSLGGSSLTSSTLPLTTYLYSGEAFDFRIGQQYLRARWYDARTGRFDRLDPFAGNSQDRQSFHKYGYVHGDPIQGIDPTGMFFGNVAFLHQALSVGFAALGALNTVHSLQYSINAVHSWLEGDTWQTIFDTSMALLHGMAAALDFQTAASVLKIPPPPPMGVAVSSVGSNGGLVVRAMLLNPAFEAWVLGNVVPVVATGIATSGLLFATGHNLRWQIRGTDGRFKHSGRLQSGSATGKSYPEQAASHTERKFIREQGHNVKKGDTVNMQGELPICRTGNPNAMHGNGQGCQIHMQWFAKLKECTVYYVDKLGEVVKIRPSGEFVKGDGTIVPAPIRAPNNFG